MILLLALTIKTDTLWVQPSDPRVYGATQTGGGNIVAWTRDLSRWMAIFTIVKGFQLQSAIMAPGFLSDWFSGGVGDAGAFLEDGTPLYMGLKRKNQAYVCAGYNLFGPYKEGIGEFVLSPDGKHWAKVMGKNDGYVLVADGKEVAGPYDFIGPVFYDSLSRLYYRFTEGDSCGLARDGELLFRYQWIGTKVFLRGDTVFCEVGKDGKWSGDKWKGSEALARNGEVISDWFSAFDLARFAKGKPVFLCGDKDKDWIAIGDSVFGPYPKIMYQLRGPDDRIYYAVSEQGGMSLYENGKLLSEKGDKAMLSAFLDDSSLGYSLSASHSGLAYTKIAPSGESYVIMNEKRFGPYNTVLLSPPFVSLDGKHIAWVMKEGDTERVWLDGKPQQGFDKIYAKESVRFSPDGKHIAYLAKDKLGVWAVLDGKAVAGPFVDPSYARGLGTTFSDIYLMDKEMAIIGIQWKEGNRVMILRVRVSF